MNDDEQLDYVIISIIIIVILKIIVAIMFCAYYQCFIRIKYGTQQNTME